MIYDFKRNKINDFGDFLNNLMNLKKSAIYIEKSFLNKTIMKFFNIVASKKNNFHIMIKHLNVNEMDI